METTFKMNHLYLLAFLFLVLFASVSVSENIENVFEDIDLEDNLDEDGFETEFGLDKVTEVFEDIDPEDNLDEEGFEAEFGLDEVTDPEEKEKRQEALKENEELVKEENEEFLNGEKTWWDKINDFSDLPDDEFEKEKTGLQLPKEAMQHGRGLIEPTGPERRDEASERYFDKFRYSRAAVPSSYSSVEKGHVSPVKNQHQCGSCAAFSNMALIETCFKKLTGAFGDYSEQELLDCAFGNENGAYGCDGAWPFAYVKWVADGKKSLSHESVYPYLNTKPKLNCPNNLESYNQGAKVTKSYYSSRGDEETIKKLVAEHGAVGVAVNADSPFEEYSGGIFAGCTSNVPTHAVTVVGYGSENGVDYWLIKNSWGPDWGEQGYIRLKRGVGMCGIGKVIVTVSCGEVDGPTDPPLTTAKPCLDKYSSCPKIAETNCHSYTEHCRKSCGLCEGMTPHLSNTCFDQWITCPRLAETSCHKYAKECRKSCGLCEGMTPHPSNTCWDKYINCPRLAETSCDKYAKVCRKSCGLCEGMTPPPSNTCLDKYSSCPKVAEFNCHSAAKDCPKSCGLCEGMTPHPTNTCWDTWEICPKLCKWYPDRCKKSCGMC